MALPEKQVLFVKEYIVDLNATQAALRAGYSPKTAGSQGQRLLKNVEIQKAIQKVKDERAERVEITADMILREYAKLGFANITDYLRVETTPVMTEMGVRELSEVTIFETDNIDPAKMAAVSEIKQTKDGISIKLHDKKGALDSMARHLGMFLDRTEHSGVARVVIVDDIMGAKDDGKTK